MNFNDVMQLPKPVPVAMPPMSTPSGNGALETYRAAIGGTAKVAPETVRAAETWHAGMAVIAAEEAKQLAEFNAAAALRQPVADDGAEFPPPRAFCLDADAQLMALKSAAEAQRLADGEAALAEERAERKRRFDEWTPDTNQPRAVLASEA